MKYTKENPDKNGFYPGWAEDGGKAQALIDKSEGHTDYVRTPEQRARMSVAQRKRRAAIMELRAEREKELAKHAEAAAKAKGKRSTSRQR